MSASSDADPPLPFIPDAKVARQVIESANVLVVGLDRSGRIQLFNRFASQLTGYTSAEARQLNWFEVLVPRDRDPVAWQTFERLIANGEPLEFESSLLTRSGHERVVAYQASVLREGDQVTGALLLGFDVTERRRVEAAVRCNEERLRFALEGTNDGLWDVQMPNGSVFLSPRGCEILGYAASELPAIAAVWSDLVHPEDLPSTRERLEAYLAGRAPVFEVEQRLRTKAGEWKWVRARGKAVERDAHGQPTRMIGTHTDINARKQAEAAQRKSEGRLRFALEKSQIGGWDLNLIDHSATRTLEHDRIFGYTTLLPHWSYEMFLEHVVPEDRAEVDRRFQGAVARQTDWSFECRIRRRDGQMRWIWAAGGHERDSTGQAHCMAGFVQDITDRKLAEAKLEESRERLARIVDTVPDGIVILGINGVVEFANPSAERILKLERASIEGRTYHDPAWKITALDGGAFPAADLPFVRVLATELPVHGVEHAIETPDGKRALLSVNAAPLRGANGSVIGVVAAINDITVRRRVELELARTSKSLADAQRIAHLGSFEIVTATQATIWSEELFRIYGLDPAGPSPAYDVMLKRCIHPDDAPVFHDTFNTARRSNAAYELEHRIIRPDGSVRWVYDRAQPHFDEQGRLQCYVGATLDITARKQAEQALQRSEQKFAIAFANNPAAIAMTSLEDGCFVDVNRSWEAMLGYHRDEVIGRSARAMHIWPTPESAARFVASLQDNGALYGWEQSFHRRSGEVFFAQLSAQVLTVQGERVILSTLVDITDRKRAEAALRESEANLREAQRVAQIGSWSFDVGSGRVTWSDELFRIFGLERDTFGGTHVAFAALIHPDDRLAVLRANELARTSGQPFEIEYRIVPPGGGRKIIREVGHAIRDAAGAVVRLYGTAQDITARKELETQLLQAQRMEAIGTLASGVAHDLNNILTPVLLMSGYLKEKLTDEGDHELIDMLRQGATRGGEIVKQLLTYSRGLGGQRQLVQLRYVLKEMVGLMRETFPRQIELHQIVASDLWPVMADQTQLHQVVLNLCVNARDAMPDGGRLSVSAKNVTLLADHAPLPKDSRPGPYVLIEVSDSGGGIPPEVRHRIFDPFFTTKPLGQGTGLGLSTVFGIVKGHEGFVAFDSEVGRGTTFRVFLPASPEETAAVAASVPAEKTPGRGQLILLVDDERSVREVTRVVLEKAGYRVVLAINGKDAVSEYLQHRPEIALVLTDLMMPLMGGLALVKALRELDPQLPIIATSGLSDVEQRRNLAVLGVTEVLAKPCGGTALLSAIQRRLGELNMGSAFDVRMVLVSAVRRTSNALTPSNRPPVAPRTAAGPPPAGE